MRLVQGVAVRAWGQGPGIVLLHANGGDHRDFESVIAGLSQSRTVYAVDWPGHGDSEALEDPSASAFAALLPAVLEQVGPPPFVLLGNSVGGFAALRAAIARPDLVSGVIGVNPGGFTPRSPVTAAVCRFIGSRSVSPTAMRLLPRLYLRRSSPWVTAIRSRALEASRSPARVRAFASVWRSFADRDHDARRDVGAIEVPTLLIWGTRDPVLPWPIDGRRAARALPRATVVRLPCGHQAFAEMLQEFLAIVEDFIHQLPIPPA